jgi:hypothetical protein
LNTCIFLQTLPNDETLPNFIKRKHPRKGEKETRDKDQSPGKQIAQKRQATGR